MILRVEDLAVAYSGRPVLDGVSFSAARGERLGVVGESGCGKSTLARAVVRLIPAERGRVTLGDTDLTSLPIHGAALLRERRRFQILFQNPYSTLNPSLTIGGHLRESLALHVGLARGPEMVARIADLLGRVGLAGRDSALPGELSGGQRRRACLARVLATSPELLIVDEPTTGLDAMARADVLSLLADVSRAVSVFMLITHDLRDVRTLCDRVLVLHGGRVAENRPAAEFHPDAEGLHSYTRLLLAAERRLARATAKPRAV